MLSGSQLSVSEELEARAAPADTKISVCHIASGDRWAGAEAQIASLLRALAERGDVVLSAVVLNEGRLAESIRELKVPVRVVPESQLGLLAIAARARDFLASARPAILHSHRYKENLLAAYLGWRCQIKHVVRTQHGLPEPFAGFRHVKHAAIQGLDGLVARFFTDRVVCVTRDVHDRVASRLELSRLAVVRNGIVTTRVRSQFSAAEAKRRLGLPPGAAVIGMAGRLEPIKRGDLFLRAAEIVSRRCIDARFVVAGDGAELEPLRRLSSSLGIAERCLFTGHRDDVYDVMRAMDVFVLCSDHEGLPMALLEIMCLGVPVVARKVGGIPEIIEDGVHGRLIDSADPAKLAEAILAALSNDVASEMARAARVRVDRLFSAAANAEEIVALYRSVVGAG